MGALLGEPEVLEPRFWSPRFHDGTAGELSPV